MLSITTNMLVCHVDLNLDGQEFESSGSEQERDPAHDAAAARRRVASRTTTFSMAATSSTQRINTQRTLRQCAAIPGSCALGAHHALGARHDALRAHACASVGGRRVAHGTRSARGVSVAIRMNPVAANADTVARHRDYATRTVCIDAFK